MRISTAESQVMRALWAKSPLSAEEIIAALPADQDWADATVKTLLNRLLKKDAIAADRDGRRFLYRPLVAQGDYVHAESQGLLDRLFDGRLAPLVAHFSQREKLSDQDVADLRRLLESLDDGK
ncbi:BlaI/MecI/CopY family transcriptional regulator [Caulobacter sp. ErkDOM-E]|jgi:BlaI family penicillinase repressor|uniref:BlaI/MecI/CopY family transcriptional regulator n=1 Tax=Caulobacter sp. ErkDOM-E TaxID=3402778 RepID=UPI003AF932F7